MLIHGCRNLVVTNEATLAQDFARPSRSPGEEKLFTMSGGQCW